MRHGDKINNLGRTASHRKAMLSNMAASLILHKSINTTVAKAKALRKYVEPLITKSKTDDQNSRRVVFSYLQNKFAVKELFGDVAEKVAQRPGGYTRILKIGSRSGDNAEMAMIELIDFNEFYAPKVKKSDAKAKKSRRGAGSSKNISDGKTEKLEVEAIVAETAVPNTTDVIAEVEVIDEKIVDTDSDASETELKKD